VPPRGGGLKVLLPVVESELVALELEDLAQLGRPAEEDGDPPLPLLADLQEVDAYFPLDLKMACIEKYLVAHCSIFSTLGGGHILYYTIQRKLAQCIEHKKIILVKRFFILF
jgi:hypothetical protein